MPRLLYVTSVDAALQASPSDVQSVDMTTRAHAEDLTSPAAGSKLPAGDARREPTEGSAFWPELDPRTRQSLIDKGYEDQVELAERVSPELSLAVNKGFPIPPALRERAVYETYKVMTMAPNHRDRLRAVEVLERMARSNDNPNALPDQLSPGESAPAGAGSPAVQVNIQNNVTGPSSEPSASVSELVDEMLGRRDVQKAIESEVLATGEDYGI